MSNASVRLQMVGTTTADIYDKLIYERNCGFSNLQFKVKSRELSKPRLSEQPGVRTGTTLAERGTAT
jgi:hypothetical protein